MAFFYGLFLGAIVGVLGLALVSTNRRRNQAQRGIDECEACKAAMCAECDSGNKLLKAREDWESLWEELQSVKRIRAQVAGAHSRVLHELWSKANSPSMGQ